MQALVKGVFHAPLQFLIFVYIKGNMFPLGSTETWHPSGAPSLVILLPVIWITAILGGLGTDFICHSCKRDQLASLCKQPDFTQFEPQV